MSVFLGSTLWLTDRSLPAQCGGYVWNRDVFRCTNTDGDGYGQVDKGSMNSHFLFITRAYEVKKVISTFLELSYAPFLERGWDETIGCEQTQNIIYCMGNHPKCVFISLVLLECSWISSFLEHYCGLTQDSVWITTQRVLFAELLICVKTTHDCLFGITVGFIPVQLFQ